jgi:hypothetical protein
MKPSVRSSAWTWREVFEQRAREEQKMIQSLGIPISLDATAKGKQGAANTLKGKGNGNDPNAKRSERRRTTPVHNQQALSRINGRVAFVMQQTVDNFISGLTQFAGTDPESAGKLEASARESIEFCYSIGAAPTEDRKCFIYNDGVAIIPIHGSLINRFGGSWGFVTGYQAIRRQMNAALEDEDVKAVRVRRGQPWRRSGRLF